MYFVIIMLLFFSIFLIQQLVAYIFNLNITNQIYISLFVAMIIGIIFNFKITYNSYIFVLILKEFEKIYTLYI